MLEDLPHDLLSVGSQTRQINLVGVPVQANYEVTCQLLILKLEFKFSGLCDHC